MSRVRASKQSEGGDAGQDVRAQVEWGGAIIFSHSEGCLFTLLIVSFDVQKLLRLITRNGRHLGQIQVEKKVHSFDALGGRL